jgi:hypothetical protein
MMDNGINAGHVRIYENNGGSWTQIGQDIDGEAAGDYSGYFCILIFRWKYSCYWSF